MSINLTLFGQMITFSLFVWFTMRFVWPPLEKTLAERQKKIADGLAAAERGHQDLALAKESAAKLLRETKEQAAQIIDESKRQGNQVIEEAKRQAKEEGERLIKQAQDEISQVVNLAKDSLRKEVSDLAFFSAEKVLEKSVNDEQHQALVEELVKAL